LLHHIFLFARNCFAFSLSGTKKCDVVKHGNGFSHDLAKRKPSRPKNRRNSYRLLRLQKKSFI